MSLVFPLLAAALLINGLATQLPSFEATETAGRNTEHAAAAGAKWWAQVDDRVYHSPTPDSGLSSDIGHYYYALGSEGALTDALKEQRVGGRGRLHIFHLPAGPSMLQMASQVGGRRSSMSQLKKLEAGVVLSTSFPAYSMHEQDYVHPLDANAQGIEKAAVAQLTPELIMAYLSRISSLPGENSTRTRSSYNPKATAAAVAFFTNEFTKLGLTVCPIDFKWGSFQLTNVVAYAPGASADTITVGAHFDSIPQSGLAPGAEDNGSGVAALLAMAQAYMSAKVCPEKSVYFVAFGGEEQGLLGSDVFAEHLKSWDHAIPDKCKPANLRATSFLQALKTQASKANSKHEAIIMDEIGWSSPSLSSHTVNLEAYDWAYGVMDHLKQSSLTHNGDSLTVVHSNNPFGSDHMSFLNRNMPGVLTINGDDEAYPDYHSSRDQIQNVNGTLLAKIARMNMGALMRGAGVRACTSTS